MAADPQDTPRHAGQVVRRVLLRRNIVIDAETAQLVATAVQAALQASAPSRRPRRRPPAPAAGSEPPAQLLDHRHRWDIARRLLHDDALDPGDRLAGLLVLLYAQGTTAISQMTTDQVQASANDVRLRLGRVPIQLPEPVATLARTVAANRKGHATIGARKPSPWLFRRVERADRGGSTGHADASGRGDRR